MSDNELKELRVPVCGTQGLTIPRSIWDEAWIAYCKEWPGSGTQSQHARLLRQGFYAEELDQLRPGWRPVQHEIERLRAQLADANEALEKWRQPIMAHPDCYESLFNEIQDDVRAALDRIKEFI